jgi:serine/threonine-protein kinase
MTDLRDRLQEALGDAYHLERELTGGGMSRLFLATERSLGRQVVIKLLPPETASEVSVARFQREIQTAAHLQHPHILPILTAGARGDLLYYVMPYVPGESLRRRLTAAGRLDVDEAVRILREIADALAYAHGHGIIHRDIKPENILILGDHAVLTDFGVARALAESTTAGAITSTGVSIGTPAYMAPEQIAGEHVDARADVYALAVVGYEMVTGVRPFTGSSAQSILAAHMTEPPPPVRQQRPELPARVSVALDRALAKDPGARFPTMDEFRKAIGSGRDSQALGAGGRQRLWLAAGAVVILLVAAGVYVTRNSGGVEGDPRRSLIVFPVRNETGDAERDWLEGGAANMLSLTLDHWRELTVYDDERTRALLRQARIGDPASLDVEQARELARKAGVGTLVLGAIRERRDSLVIEAKLHDVRSGSRISTEIVRVAAGLDPRAAFDTIASRILRVGRVPPGEHPGAVAQTTSSLEAYRSYLAGMDALQSFHTDSARRLFERAVTTDSTFALAYLRLVQTLGWVRPQAPNEMRRELARKAQRHGTALPARLRTLIEMEVAQREGAWARARQLARAIVARDSLDAEAWYQLGEAEYHHNSFRIPHADSLGDAGRALRAFETALALDSGYHLAYRHVVDLRFFCSENPFVWCGSDSANYAPSFSQPFSDGARAQEFRSNQALFAQKIGPTLQSWIAAEPTSEIPREIYLTWLLVEQRLDEAESQLARFRESQSDPLAFAAFDAMLAIGRERYADAADHARPLLAALERDSTNLGRYTLPLNRSVPIAMTAWFSAAGQFARARTAFELLESDMGLPPCLSGGGTECVPITREQGRRFLAGVRLVAFGTTGAMQRRGLAILDSLTRGNAALRRVMLDDSPGILASYRQTRDTVLLSRWLSATQSEHPSARALLLIVRGDEGEARRLLERHGASPERIPAFRTYRREEAILNRYAWADVLAALGEQRRALAEYEMLDTIPLQLADWEPLHVSRVMAFAERAALHEELGERTQAIALYERFADAWRDADPELQPMVRRAREAAARLRGEARERAPDS